MTSLSYKNKKNKNLLKSVLNDLHIILHDKISLTTHTHTEVVSVYPNIYYQVKASVHNALLESAMSRLWYLWKHHKIP